MEDNETNKFLMEEFRKNYLPQRAQFEGWNYNPSNFDVTYFPKPNFPVSETFIANPLKDDSVGFSNVGNDIFIRVPQSRLKKIIGGLTNFISGKNK